MTFSMRRLKAIVKLKFKMVLSNLSVMTGPLMTIGMVVLYKAVYTQVATGDAEQLSGMLNFVLTMGLMMNIAMGGMMLTCTPLAEEKEKNTLRSLMTSSISGAEYFIGSLIPPVFIMVVTNIAIVFISGVNLSNFSWPIYLIFTTIASLASCVLGMLIAMFSPNQMAANTYLMPFALGLMFVPILADITPTMSKISSFLYTGVLTEMLAIFSSGQKYVVSMTHITVLMGQLFLIFGLFVFFYKRNGYEQD